MRAKELQQVYRTPVAKVVEIGICRVLCQSDEPATLGGSDTEQLVEDDKSGSIW